MEITAAHVKDLRNKTGAGVMDCKEALAETGGNIEEAVDYLRKKGVLKAAKKAERATGDGMIASYIHAGSKLGVLVEINCETDFVARTEQFQEFARDIAMHIAAQNPAVVSRDELSEKDLEREGAIYKEQALASGKPENIVDKIVQGRIEKYYAEVCLLEQPFVKDNDITVEDVVKRMIASIGENIRIKRFVRMKLGEGTESGEES